MGHEPVFCDLCRVNARTWVYPLGTKERSYQLSIIQTALLHNTLVCLPTGLGKTLIAAVIMHNFSRWFPEVSISTPTSSVCNSCERVQVNRVGWYCQITACFSMLQP